MFFAPYADRTQDPLATHRHVPDGMQGGEIIDITAVGARISNGHLSKPDAYHLEQSIRLLHEKAIVVSPEFRLTTLNIHDDARQDFLKHPPKSHLVIICFVFNGKERRSDGTFNQSDIHTRCGAWYQAAIESGTKFIVTFGTHVSEVCSRNFVRPQHGKGPSFMEVSGTDNGFASRPVEMLVRSDVARNYSRLGALKAITA